MSEQYTELVPLKDLKKDKNNPNNPEEPKKGKALKKLSTVFFVFTCICAVLIGLTIALPALITIVGLLSAIVWVVFILTGSIFTLGMMWLSDDVKQFNQWWMDTNTKLFDSGNNVAEFGTKVVPIIAIVGGAFMLITWALLIIGFNTDEYRHKTYKGQIIALGIITGISIALLIIALIMIYSNKTA